MGQVKAHLKKILYPPAWITTVLVLLAGVLLFVVFHFGMEDMAFAYVIYPFSSYALVILVLRLPGLFRKIRDGIYRLSIVKKIEANSIGRQLLNDISFRETVSIYQGLLISLFYAIFRGVTAFLYSSVWFGTIAVYYVMICAVRLTLAENVRRVKRRSTQEERLLYEYKSYRLCGYLMFMLNTGMTGMVILMVRDNMHYEYPGSVIYASAAYTFYVAIMATINLFKYRRLKSPILSASKAITFVSALMSVLALQTALIAQFGGNDAFFRKTANGITGTMVCVGVLGVALYMIVRAGKKIRLIRAGKEHDI